ncbi:C40 family peptidase [Nocardia sp. CA-135953]|uniref:C40 family peptidase n=1 Tax=Nocardia sp. CA-135953 TaxID=3239978 RepID=UPI003D967764
MAFATPKTRGDRRMETSRTTIAFAAALPLLLTVSTLSMLVMIGSQNPATCTLAAASGGGIEGPTGITLAGLNEAQLKLARNGVVIGIQRRQARTVIIAEIAAQITESGLRNLANPSVPESLRFANDGTGNNLDSLGPHQMRAGVWGAVGIATLMDPIYQIGWFYDQADKISGAAAMSPAELAQAIEISGNPTAYSHDLPLAEDLYSAFAGIDVGQLPATSPGQLPAGCGADGAGLVIPGNTGPFSQSVVEAAARWLGTPYVWGGGDANGPTNGGMDCSGLTLYAIYQASQGRIRLRLRLRLAHYTQAQQDDPAGQAIPFAQRQPGDLIFFTQPGASDSHHVGIFYGTDAQGRDLLLHAPTFGQTVTIEPLWQGERMDVRRYG